MPHTIDRLHVVHGGVSYALAPTEHLDAVTTAARDAVRAGGDFVEVALDNGQRLSILVTPSSVLVITTETIRVDGGRGDDLDRVETDDIPSPTYDADNPWDII